jgi:PPOX class probable F420-dependent enzyme
LPRPPISNSYAALLQGANLGHLATVDRQGKPQVNPVWFLWDGTNLLIGVKAETVKYRNLRSNPHLALSIVDPGQPGHYIELRGEVVEFKRYLDLTFVNQLSRKYTGHDMDPAQDGLERYRLTVRIDSWTGQ